jgi:hypothetical protein
MKLLLYHLLWLGSLAALAQSPRQRTEIQGVTVDSLSSRPLRTASVSLLSAADSTYVMGTITDGDGRFRLRNVPTGTYRMLVTFVGYRNASRRLTVMGNTPVVAMDTLRLTEQVNVLNEVVIQQERPPVRVKGDTLEFNASSFKTQPNAVVEDLLRKLPGVEVSRDGTIKAQGQTVNRVLVDGKPFFGNDAKIATRNLNADIVENVQLYDQQSDQAQFSGMDDGNRERTINLTIKRDKRKGYFGQNAAGAGTDGRYQGRLNLNRFNNGRQLSLIGQANNINQQNFTLGGGRGNGPVVMGGPGSFAVGNDQPPTNITEVNAVGVNYRDKVGKRAELATSYFLNGATTTTEQQSQRANILPDGSFTTDQTTYTLDRQGAHRFNARLDWQLDSLTTFRLMPNLVWQRTSLDNRLGSRSFLPGGQPFNRGETYLGTSGDGFSGNTNALLMRKFRREGRTLSLNLNSVLSANAMTAFNRSVNTFFGSDSVRAVRLNQRGLQDNGVRQHTLTASFTEPLSLTRKLEVRYAYARNQNGAERAVSDFTEATSQYDRPNAALSNRFGSVFMTHQAGATLQTRRLFYTYALGLEAQHADLRVTNLSADTSQSRTYLNMLPNALLNYTFSRNRTLRLQYRTRIVPPSVSQLQPVPDNTNPLLIRLGNPTLRPEYYNNLVLTYNSTQHLGTRSLFVLMALNQSNNRIGTATDISPAGVQTVRPINAGGYWAANGVMAANRTLRAIRLNASATTQTALERSLSYLNSQPNEVRVLTLGQGLRLQSTYNGKIEYGLGANLTYQRITYSLRSRQNTAFWSQLVTADVHWQLPLGFVVNTDLTYTATSGRSAGFNQRFMLWNAWLGKQFLKGKQGEVRVQAFDLLNQNRSLVRNTGDTFVEDVQSRVLNRYVMVSLLYHLRKFGV